MLTSRKIRIALTELGHWEGDLGVSVEANPGGRLAWVRWWLWPTTWRPCHANHRQLTGHKHAFDGSAAVNGRSRRDTSHSPSHLGCLEVGLFQFPEARQKVSVILDSSSWMRRV